MTIYKIYFPKSFPKLNCTLVQDQARMSLHPKKLNLFERELYIFSVVSPLRGYWFTPWQSQRAFFANETVLKDSFHQAPETSLQLALKKKSSKHRQCRQTPQQQLFHISIHTTLINIDHSLQWLALRNNSNSQNLSLPALPLTVKTQSTQHSTCWIQLICFCLTGSKVGAPCLENSNIHNTN